MSFYRRKPDPVRAARIGQPLTADWIERLVADRRVQLGPQNGVFVKSNLRGGGTLIRAAYPGQWLVWHSATDAVEVLDDDVFHQRYEEDHAA